MLPRGKAPRDARRYALGLVLAALAANSAQAQSGGILVGVVDGAGAALPGATVTISHETGHVKVTAMLTDEEGRAEFPVLRPGPGYSVQVGFPGYSTVRQDGLRVVINGTTAISIQMIEEISEAVRVQGRRGVVALEQAETSTKLSSAFVDGLPVRGRFYQNVLTLVPGVQDVDGDGNPTVHGSRERDFSAMVGGVRNVDPLTGHWMSRINPNSIEEIEVISAGAGVEFGRAQGGVARIVQKQGNNQHEGVFDLFYRSSELDAEPAGGVANIGAPRYQWIQPAVQFSGPILRDKLWYRLSHEYRLIEEPVAVPARFDLTTVEQWTHSDQITWQVSPRNKLAFLFQSDPSFIADFGVGPTRTIDAAEDRERTGVNYSLTWTAPYSPRILVETLLAWQDVEVVIEPSSPGQDNRCLVGPDLLEQSHCRNLNTGLTTGSFYRTQNDHSQRLTLSAKATIYSRFWGTGHQLKVGFSVENERYFRSLEQRPYGTFWIDYEFTPIRRYEINLSYPESDNVRATGTNWAVYFEDQLKPRQNLTLTVGMRVDREELTSDGASQFDPSAELREYEELLEPLLPSSPADPLPPMIQNLASNAWPRIFTGYEDFPDYSRELQQIVCRDVPTPVQQSCRTEVETNLLDQRTSDLATLRRQENFVISNANFSPFLAVAWSPGSNGKTAIKASAGRHYNNIPLIVPLYEQEPIVTQVNYRQSWRLMGDIPATPTMRTVDRNLRTPYQDELTFKFERELWPETSLALTYISRKFRDQIQDVNINLATGDYGYCGPSPSHSVVRSPGSGRTVTDGVTHESYVDTAAGIGDGRPDDCVTGGDGLADLYVQNPFWGNILQLSNSNEIDYEAFVFELIRRQFRGWELQASYVWSEAIGDGEDFFQEAGNDPSLGREYRGYQSYDQRHVVKVNAMTITPWGIRAGGSLGWQSGLPYSTTYEVFTYDTAAPILYLTNLGASRASTRQTFSNGQRNDQRNSSYWDIDVKVAKDFRLGSAGNLQLSLEVFNLLNEQTYVLWDPATKAGEQLNGINQAVYRTGRQFQLGLRVAF